MPQLAIQNTHLHLHLHFFSPFLPIDPMPQLSRELSLKEKDLKKSRAAVFYSLTVVITLAVVILDLNSGL